jgi:HEPN domain-containing protein
MPDIEAARMSLSAARRDLQALENMQNPEAFPAEIYGFHAQQTVEKTLKAWLALLDQECPRTHSIRQLLVLLEQVGVNVDPWWDFIELAAFAVQFRYEAYEDLDPWINRPDLLANIHRLTFHVEGLFQNQG